jgi:hypothetical protein
LQEVAVDPDFFGIGVVQDGFSVTRKQDEQLFSTLLLWMAKQSNNALRNIHLHDYGMGLDYFVMSFFL